MNGMKKPVLVSSLLLVSWGSSISRAATIHTKATFSGAPPAPATIKMAADAFCLKEHAQGMKDESAVVGPGGSLANVFVYIKSGLSGKNFPASKEPVVFDQKGCWYAPRVFGIQVNQPLQIINSDPTLHNVNVMAKLNSPFNTAMPVKGMKITKTFTKPEVMIKVKCNVHPWMGAYIGVVDHPFFGVTKKDGGISLTNVPAGTYVLEAWHEKYGTSSQEVTVAEADTKTVQFAFKAK